MRIAVGIVHGIGQQHDDFHSELTAKLQEAMAALNPRVRLIVEGIYWGDITDSLEKKLWQRTNADRLRWNETLKLRSFIVNYIGDAIAYQAIPKDNDPCPRDYIYDDIHARYAQQLQRLANRAGDDAPLCIIAHSLGTIISSNYFYDLQYRRMRPKAAEFIRSSRSKLVGGETLTHFYTLGSPIALWNMRFEHFGTPISVPAPALKPLGIGEWINFYDRDDVIAYPLQGLNADYAAAVTADIEVRCPGPLGWTPVSHGGYFRSRPLIRRIAQSLDRMSRTIPGGLPD
ncbi:chemotaxis protein [Paenibacillus rhizovicinus]|uniref:Chemotaxis protein n=1 Tax=Paenibacillus rhizovicinus TaxID=2704463 RepID=A0A6C0P017_9BACL|nr:chemotaxis protein [Paenibacillus rhizovicinus]QHW31825.1 chemotaxis protein [Paenibacillus rhizovicinus]